MRPRTLSDHLPVASDWRPEGTALIAGDSEVSYRELERRSARAAATLVAAGAARGDRVLTVLPNGVTAAITAHAVFRSGAALVPLAADTKPHQLAYIAKRIRPTIVVCTPESRAEVHRAVEPAGDPVVIDEPEAIAGDLPPLPTPLADDLAVVLYTSGSTGRPKGAMLTHHNLTSVTESIVEYLRISEGDRILCALQLSFGYGLSQLLCCSHAAATLVLDEGFALPGAAIATMERHKVTGFPGVPTMFHVLSALEGFSDRELPNLRFLTNAGAALPAAAVESLRRTFPHADLYSMYGLTECIRVSYLEPAMLNLRPSSCGRPIPGTDAWVERDGKRVPPGEVGELIVRGPHVMQGYWEDPDATAARMRLGIWPWERELATGDLFRLDDEGYLFWLGRTDDLIKCRGLKVYPREVEEVLHEIDGVQEAAVVGVPDPLLGDRVAAHVVATKGSGIDEKLIRRRCAERLDAHKVPGDVVFHERLPRTPRQKIDKSSLIRTATAPR